MIFCRLRSVGTWKEGIFADSVGFSVIHKESEFWLAVGIFELVGEPVKTFIEAIT